MAATGATFRERVREQLHTAILDAAREQAVERGWRNVRMGDVAAAVGVSRQTVYAEFHNKDALAEQLAVRELRHLLLALSNELDGLDGDLHSVVRAGVLFVLREAEANTVLHAALTGARPADNELLPLLLKSVEPIILAAQGILVAFAGQRFPEVDPERLDLCVESLVRLVVSYLVLPVHPHEEIATRVASATTRIAGLA
ncbi:MAG TPA: TetR family transcriptional regulator [Pseudonocardiaceae bacterium]